MDAVQQLPAKDQADFMRTLETLQLEDSLRTYNRTVELCFSSCVTSFGSKNINAKEKSCLSHCAQKFIKHSQRTGVRFAEAQQQMATNQGASS